MESMASFSFMEYVLYDYVCIYIYIYIYILYQPQMWIFPNSYGAFRTAFCRTYCQMAASRGDAQSILTILTNPLHKP